MNPVVFIHFFAAVLAIVAALPLARGRVGRNPWYGVRLPATFSSEERWREINAYFGWRLLGWGLGLAAMAIVGGLITRRYWVTYNWVACALILGGLAWVVVATLRRARE